MTSTTAEAQDLKGPLAPPNTRVVNVPLGDIIPDPAQPRKSFDEEKMAALCSSIKAEGQLQPISVRPAPDSTEKHKTYIIISGERRWRAHVMLEAPTIQAIVFKNLSDAHVAKLQLLENIVRADLNPVEEARALGKMLDEGYTMSEISKATGITPAYVRFKVDILKCNDEVIQLVEAGHITGDSAYGIAQLNSENQMVVLRALTRSSKGLDSLEMARLTKRLEAEEAKPGTLYQMMTDEKVARARSVFADTFAKIDQSLDALLKMDDNSPGSLAAAMGGTDAVTEDSILALKRKLEKVRRSCIDGRMTQLVIDTMSEDANPVV